MDVQDLTTFMEVAGEGHRLAVLDVVNRLGPTTHVLEPLNVRAIGRNSHWVTWRPAGLSGLLVHLDQGHGVYFVTNGATAVYKLLGAAAANGDIVLAGTLAWRIVSNGATETEANRLRTLASLTRPQDDEFQGARRPVFLARECLHWITPRVPSDPLQTRMVMARTIVEGDGVSPPILQQTGGRFSVAYQPHMAPVQAAILVRDVPPPLIGTQLTGIELRPMDGYGGERPETAWRFAAETTEAYDAIAEKLCP